MKLLKLINNIIPFIFAAAVISGCGKEPEKTDYIAKVNNAYLTSDELNSMMDSSSNKNKFFKSELIRNWINRELLFQEAKRKGVLDEKEFKRILFDSKKELAASLLLKNYYDEEEVSASENELEDFYNQRQNIFKLNNDAFLINIISFSDEDKAVQFRNTVLEKDWEKALDVFKGDSSIKKNKTGEFLFDYEIYPIELLRVAKELMPEEISIILSTNENEFYLIQVKEKFSAGTIPPLNVIKQKVENRLLFEKKEALFKDYIKELYNNNDIDVKN